MAARLTAYDLKIGMEFVARGTAGNVYKIFMIDWTTKEVRLKRVRDQQVFKYTIHDFITLFPTLFAYELD